MEFQQRVFSQTRFLIVSEKNSPGYTYDIKKAKELLKEAGYKENKDGILERTARLCHLS